MSNEEFNDFSQVPVSLPELKEELPKKKVVHELEWHRVSGIHAFEDGKFFKAKIHDKPDTYWFPAELFEFDLSKKVCN